MTGEIKRGTPLEIFNAILSDIDDAFLAKDWDRYDDKMHELRNHVEPLLTPPLSEDWKRFGLTPAQARVADVLMLHIGKPVSKRAIFNSVYGNYVGEEPSSKVIDVYICKLRKNLAPAYHIETVYGQGYKLVAGEGPKITFPQCMRRNGMRGHAHQLAA